MDSWGLRSLTDRPVLAVRVEKSSCGRALRLLMCLLKLLEKRGIGLVRHCLSNVLGFGKGEDSLHFTLSDHTPRDKAQKLTGALSLKLEIEPHALNGLHRSWTDCKRYNLEQKLGEMVEWIAAGVETTKQRRLALEVEEKRRREEQEQQEALRRAQVQEEKHRAKLLEQSARWHQAKLLRMFLDACESEFKPANPPLLANSSEAKWLAWARAHADRIDPLKNGFLETEKKRLS
jgi:hypothetical protein